MNHVEQHPHPTPDLPDSEPTRSWPGLEDWLAVTAEIDALERAIAGARAPALAEAWDPGRQEVTWHPDTVPPSIAVVPARDTGSQTIRLASAEESRT